MQKSSLANTAISLYENGLVVEAIDTLSRAIAENPHESELYYQLGHIFKDQRAFDKAAQSYIKVLSLTPHHSGAYTHLGVALKEMGRFERAIESY